MSCACAKVILSLTSFLDARVHCAVTVVFAAGDELIVGRHRLTVEAEAREGIARLGEGVVAQLHVGRICLGHRHGTLAIAGAAVTVEGGGVALGIQGELIGRIAVIGKIRPHMLAHAGGAVAVIHHSSSVLRGRQSGIEGTGAVLAAKAHGTAAAHSAGRTFDLAVDIHIHIGAHDAISS